MQGHNYADYMRKTEKRYVHTIAMLLLLSQRSNQNPDFALNHFAVIVTKY